MAACCSNKHKHGSDVSDESAAKDEKRLRLLACAAFSTDSYCPDISDFCWYQMVGSQEVTASSHYKRVQLRSQSYLDAERFRYQGSHGRTDFDMGARFFSFLVIWFPF